MEIKLLAGLVSTELVLEKARGMHSNVRTLMCPFMNFRSMFQMASSEKTGAGIAVNAGPEATVLSGSTQ